MSNRAPHPSSRPTVARGAAIALVPAMLAAILGGCAGPDTDLTDSDTTDRSETIQTMESPTRPDVHSFARPDEVTVDSLDLDLTVDFEARQLRGRASLHLDHRADGRAASRQLHLDTRDLDVAAVTLDGGREASFRLGDEVPILGRELVVEIFPETAVVHVDYSTRPEAAALQWLTPEQTAGKRHPFLFSQSQAALARTWVPCQDSPGVRFPYRATLRVPAELMAVMSAENTTEKSADGIFTFEMPQPIPSYLLALAVGDLEFRSLGPRTGVYAEPSVVEKAAWEFAETEQMIDAVSELYGPYRWGRYDILVLPPSFPFGGMENPRLTFATPTILAGDRSLVALVAHELAHSWSGNLVTNATWDDFWLNEGFTVYLERRIMEALKGRAYSEMLALLGRQDLEATVARLGPTSPDTHLRLSLAGRDPDDGMTDVAYEKGYSLLRRLEEAVGRERWDVFLKGYFERNAFRSLTTDGFLAQLRSELLADRPGLEEELGLAEWIDAPGIPADAPRPESEAFSRVAAQIEAWKEGKAATDLATGSWTTHEWLHFVRGLPETMSAERMAELDEAFSFDTANAEIRHAWLHHVIASRYEPSYPVLEDFLTGMGRRKFLQPLYTRLAATEDGLAMARKIYSRARAGYHPVSVATIDPLLDWQDPAGPTPE